MENKFLLIGNNLFNSKSHDLVNIYFPEFYKTFYMSSNEIIKFISNNNDPNNKILLYNQGGPTNHFYFPIIKYLTSNENNIKSKIYIFSFDWWFHNTNGSITNNNCLKLMFKPKNFKLFTFSNLDTISNFHKINYNEYRENIITNNIWCCYNSSFIKFNENPIKKLAVSGAISQKHYPQRDKISKLNDVFIVPKNTNKHSNNNIYNFILNKYIACFSSSVYVYNYNCKKYENTHCILLKNYEILASGSLLVVPETETVYLEEELGLKEGIHFLSIDFKKNIQAQINSILENPEINIIRKCGQNYAKDNLNSNKKFLEINSYL